MTWLGVGYLGIAVLASRGREPGPRTRKLYESLADVSPRAMPRLRVASRLRRLALVGLFRPTILIPAELETDAPPGEGATDEVLRMTLLHELAHARGRDPGFGLAGHVAQTLWFFIPPLWWIVRQMRLDQEFLADYLAAASFGAQGRYASSLLDFASGQTAAAPTAAQSQALASRLESDAELSPLAQRVLMLVRRPFPLELRPPFWWSLALPCLATLVTLSVASLRFDAEAFGSVIGRMSPGRVPQGPGSRTFRVGRLELPAKIAGPLGRVPAFELPIRLPDHFELSLEILASAGDFAFLRIAGVPLDFAVTQVPAGPPTWHRVRIVRDGKVSVSIDDGPARTVLERVGLTPWLSLEPAPDREGRYRRLMLSW
ncbi:MAG: M56 family metallopeptidase [Isosphaeraceae bacterium]